MLRSRSTTTRATHGIRTRLDCITKAVPRQQGPGGVLGLAAILFLACASTPPVVLNKAVPVVDPCYGQEICMTFEDKPRQREERLPPPTSAVQAHRNGIEYAPRKLSCEEEAPTPGLEPGTPRLTAACSTN